MAIATVVWFTLLALGCLSIFGLIVGIFYRRATSVLFVAAIPVLTLAEYPSSFNILVAAGITVSFLDLFSAAILVVFLLKLPVLRYHLIVKLLLAFAAMVAFSILAGASQFGLNLAVNESRQFLWTISCLLWSSTLDWHSPKFLRYVLKSLVTLGWLLTGVAIVQVLQKGFSTYGDDFVDAAGNTIDGRILVSGQALMLVFSLLAAFVLGRNKGASRLWALSGAMFLIVVILSQQRTVWAVAVVVMVVAFCLGRDRRFSDLLLAISTGVVLLVLISSGAVDSLMAQIMSASQNTKTYDGRTEGWLALVAEAGGKGPVTIAFGDVFGAGYQRVELGRTVAWNPHNWYLNIFLRVGLVGLVLYCSAMLLGIVAVIRHRSSMFFLSALVATSVYSWTYNAPWYAALLLGGAFSISQNAATSVPVSPQSHLQDHRPGRTEP